MFYQMNVLKSFETHMFFFIHIKKDIKLFEIVKQGYWDQACVLK